MTDLRKQPIPVEEAEFIAEAYGYSQVIIIARAVGSGPDSGEHLTTYGLDPDNCTAAARIGFFLKHEIMQWPTGLTCTGCQQQVQEDWTYCPYCSAQGRAVAESFQSAARPASNFGPFEVAILRHVASDIGCTYEQMTDDFSRTFPKKDSKQCP